MYIHFPFYICVYVSSRPSFHKSVIQASSVLLIFRTLKHKFTAITSCHKYTDACTEHRRSEKDTLQCTF